MPQKSVTIDAKTQIHYKYKCNFPNNTHNLFSFFFPFFSFCFSNSPGCPCTRSVDRLDANSQNSFCFCFLSVGLRACATTARLVHTILMLLCIMFLKNLIYTFKNIIKIFTNKNYLCFNIYFKCLIVRVWLYGHAHSGQVLWSPEHHSPWSSSHRCLWAAQVGTGKQTQVLGKTAL